MHHREPDRRVLPASSVNRLPGAISFRPRRMRPLARAAAHHFPNPVFFAGQLRFTRKTP
jgi:hypothetical protein